MSEHLSVTTPLEVRQLFDKTMLLDVQNEDQRDVPDGEIFRKEAVDVAASEKIIHSGLNPESNIISAMSETLSILNDENISLLVRVAIFHYLFGYIHPFYNGNGRMSRFISSAYLVRKLDVLSALQLSVSCKKNQKKYYESYKITNDIRNKGDLTFFVISFLEIIKDGLETFKNSISDKTEQYFYYKDKINKMNLSDKHCKLLLDVLLQCTLFGAKDLSVDDLVKISGTCKATVKKKLSNADVVKVLKIDTTRKRYEYSLDLESLEKIK